MKNKDPVLIKRGTCILTEKPFVYILNSKYRRERCDFCLKSNKVLKCSKCQYVYYCNRQCQVEHWPLHKIECEYLKKIFPRTIPDAARMLSRIILKLQKGGDLEKSYYTDKCYRKFRDMMSHYAELKTDEKKLEHLECLRNVLTDLLGDNLVPNPSELLGIYGRLVTNGFNILDGEMNTIGTGIYLAVSVTDHSCVPNAVATFEGTTLHIRVIEDMPCLDWSKIFISYVDLLNTSEQRRNDLKENYYFLCICSKCTDAKETIEMNAAICFNKKCKAPINMLKNKCSKCNAIISKIRHDKYNEIMDFTKNHLENMKETAYFDVSRICLEKQKDIFHPLNIWHIKTLDAAFEGAINLNKWSEALEFGNKLIPGFKKYYGEWNPLLGLLYMKVGKIQLYEGCPKEAVHNFDLASKIIEVTHGKDHSLYKEQLLPLFVQAAVECENK